MSLRMPTILASPGRDPSGSARAPGIRRSDRVRDRPRRCDRSRPPRVRCLATAAGDSPFAIASFYDAALQCGMHGSHLTAFPMPNLDHIREHLLDQDVIWVGGGGVAGLLAIWRLHGWDEILHEVWQAGIVQTCTSAGRSAGTWAAPPTPSGRPLRPVTNGLAFLPYANALRLRESATTGRAALPGHRIHRGRRRNRR
jgi:hypothetical protein